MMPLGWVLLQSDWCPYKKRKFGHKNRQQKRETERDTRGVCTEARSCEDRERVATCKDRDLRRNHTCWHLELGLQASGLWENKFLLFSHWGCGVLLREPEQIKIEALFPKPWWPFCVELRSMWCSSHLLPRSLCPFGHCPYPPCSLQFV